MNNIAPATEPKSEDSKRIDRRAWLCVALIVLSTALIRWRLLETPLERDEGEYAYAGQLMLQGIPPYQLAYNMKLPGTYAAYAVLMAIFGQSTVGIHQALLLVNGITIVLVFLLGRRLLGAWEGVVAAASFAVLSISPTVLGFAAHATHFITVFAMAGLLAFLKALDSGNRWRYLGSGVLLGLAFLMKQHAVFFLIFGLLCVLVGELRRTPLSWRSSAGRVLFFGMGVFAPFALTCAALALLGVFDRFWFWTFRYAQEYVSQVPWSRVVLIFEESIFETIGANYWIWILALVGLVGIWREPAWRRHAWFISGLLLFSFLAICPGFYFRPHYYIVMLPAVSILAGAGVGWAEHARLRRQLPKSPTLWFPVAAFLVVLCITLGKQEHQLFRMSPRELCWSVYDGDPFVEAVTAARYIEEHSTPADRIAVIGNEPEIYFYAKRRSATGYLYHYPFDENHPYKDMMQRELIGQIESALPKFIVETGGAYAINRRASPILNWLDGFYAKNYDLVGLTDVTGTPGDWFWNERVAEFEPKAITILSIYRRREAPPKE